MFSVTEPQNPTPAEMMILLQAVAITQGAVLACSMDAMGAPAFGPEWVFITARDWWELYGPHEYEERVPGHEFFIDYMDAGENRLECHCGELLWPDCDVSAASIMEEFDRHIAEVKAR